MTIETDMAVPQKAKNRMQLWCFEDSYVSIEQKQLQADVYHGGIQNNEMYNRAKCPTTDEWVK